MARTVQPDRFLVIPCEAPGCEDLFVIWDAQEQSVIDVLSAPEANAYLPEHL